MGQHLVLERGRPRRQVTEPAALVVRVLGGGVGLGTLARHPLFGGAHRTVIVRYADLHGLDLGAQRRELDTLAVGQDRTFAQFCDDLGEVGLLVGQGAFGLVQGGRLDLEFLLGGAELIAQASLARLEGEHSRSLFTEFFLELIDGVSLLAELGKLAGGFRLHLLDAHFQPPRRHGELGAQLVLVGANFSDRQRRRRLQPPHGQPDCTIMDQGDEQQSEQRRDKESDPEIHDRFDHDTTLWTPPTRLEQAAIPPRLREA